jgi:hypothetical protein
MPSTFGTKYVQGLNHNDRQSLAAVLLISGDNAQRGTVLNDNPKQAFVWSANAVLERLVASKRS